MGLFQDQTSSLSEIKRLAALVMDPSRRDEIGPDQWPLAMIAYGLVTCNEMGREEEGVTITTSSSPAAHRTRGANARCNWPPSSASARGTDGGPSCPSP